MKQLFLCVVCILLLSSCEYNVGGNINNKTDSDIRIVCHLVEKNRWDTLQCQSFPNYKLQTGGIYFVVSDIKEGSDSHFTKIDDTTYFVTLSPDKSLDMRLPMNYFWTEKRLNAYLQYLKRIEIQMPHDTIVYDGEKGLNDFFWDHKKSKQEICINIRDDSFMKLIDRLF